MVYSYNVVIFAQKLAVWGVKARVILETSRFSALGLKPTFFAYKKIKIEVDIYGLGIAESSSVNSNFFASIFSKNLEENQICLYV